MQEHTFSLVTVALNKDGKVFVGVYDPKILGQKY